jgi:hypothetical protein
MFGSVAFIKRSLFLIARICWEDGIPTQKKRPRDEITSFWRAMTRTACGIDLIPRSQTTRRDE